MKIIIPNLPIPIVHYIAQCIEAVNYKTNNDITILLWDINHTSIIDMFDELQPDLVFLHTSQINASFLTICKDFKFKYVLMTDNRKWLPSIPISLPQSPNAIINLSRSNNQDPKDQNVIDVKSMTNIPSVQNARYIDKLQSTIVIDASFASLNDDIMGLLSYVTSEYPTKIIGQQRVPLHQYLGKTDIVQRANLFKSAKIVIDIGHVGDCWDAAYLQVPAISIYPSNGSIFYCSNLSFLKLHLNSLLKNDLVRTKYITETYKDACNNTSFHFSAEVFTMIDEPRLAQTVLNVLETLI